MLDNLRELEILAWRGELDYTRFPPAEYKFFEAVTRLGERHRNEKIPTDFLKDDIFKARDTYKSEARLEAVKSAIERDETVES